MPFDSSYYVSLYTFFKNATERWPRSVTWDHQGPVVVHGSKHVLRDAEILASEIAAKHGGLSQAIVDRTLQDGRPAIVVDYKPVAPSNV